MAIKAISMTSLSDDAASVLTIGGLGKGDSIPYDKLQTFTLVRRDGRWMCAAFQNTEMSRRAKRQYNATYSRLNGPPIERLERAGADELGGIVRCVLG